MVRMWKGQSALSLKSIMQPEIKKCIGYQVICRFPTLVNKCMIYDKGCMAHFVHYKSVSKRKGNNQYRGKPYSALDEKGKQRDSDEKNPSVGETLASVKCFKCGKLGHCTNECKNNVLRRNTFVCLLDCAERLSLKLPSIVGNMIIETPTLGQVTTSWVCLNIPLTVFGKKIGMDLVCLPLINIDLILGMNWLVFNRVHINYYDKMVSFPDFDASNELFVSAKQVDELVKDEAEMFMILASMKEESKVMIGELPVVCDFREVFSYDISDLPLEREIKFSIDLVPGTSPMSMALY
ncbi:uncharacterized protein LOC127136541 [Lathyrus oleraceus]|uniref:uncharacterized protein LOC127136541 n=1 Tax=Pisum sativum TaxID=3888 RepID=UPI0021D3D416|nr:uncharacterized protein LOC127136541 [Pisum sativum]